MTVCSFFCQNQFLVFMCQSPVENNIFTPVLDVIASQEIFYIQYTGHLSITYLLTQRAQPNSTQVTPKSL